MTEQSEELAVDETTEAAQVETTGDSTSPSTETSEEQEKAKQSKTQNAKQRLRRKLREEQELRMKEEAERKALQEKLDALEKKIEGVLNPPPPRPSRVDFETEEAYEDALFDWRDRMRNAESQAPASPEPVTEQPQAPQQPDVDPQLKENWQKQEEAMLDKYDDFLDVVYSIPPDNMTDVMATAIAESQTGGEVAYYLGTNPAEAERIARLSIAQQAIEISKLSEQFVSKETSAPAPIDPLSGAGESTATATDPLLDGAKFE